MASTMVLNGRAATNALAMAGVIDGMVASVASGTAFRSARPCAHLRTRRGASRRMSARIPVAIDSKRARVMDALLWL